MHALWLSRSGRINLRFEPRALLISASFLSSPSWAEEASATDPTESLAADEQPTDSEDSVPAEEVPAEEVPAEEVPAEEVPAEEVPAEEVPAEEVPAAEYPPLSAALVPPPPIESSPAAASGQAPSAEPASSKESTPNASQPQKTAPSADDAEKKFDGGLYFDLNFAPVFGLKSTHEWKQNCPVISDPSGTLSWSPDCKTSAPVGGMLQSNFGYRIGIVGLEGFGFFSGDYSSAKLEGQKPSIPLPSFATNMQVGRVGGALGGGVRVMNNSGLRVSAGIGGGVVFRHVYTNVSSLDGSSTGYTSPIIKADLTLSLGKFLNLGIMGWIEFSKKIVVTPKLDSASSLVGSDPATDAALGAIEAGIGDVTVFSGTQYFVAPYIGFHFGK